MNISADHLSGEDYGRQRDIYTQMRGSEPGPTLLYVTPEKVSNREQLILDRFLTGSGSGMLLQRESGSII
jgi:hypothetical protein